MLPLRVDGSQLSKKEVSIYILNTHTMRFEPSYGTRVFCCIETYGARRAPFRGGAVIALGVATLQVESLRELIRI